MKQADKKQVAKALLAVAAELEAASSPQELEVIVDSNDEIGADEELVVTLNDEQIGWLSVFRDEEALNEYTENYLRLQFLGLPEGRIGYILNIEIPENLRGEGLGKKAVQLLLEEAEMSGVAAVTLNSDSSAYDFWLKMGFKPLDPKIADSQMILKF